jgi:hypothetical protein
MAGSGWGNPVVGGTTLRIPAIQSPNFSLINSTGWAIFADGSAYFFNVTVAGTITGGTLVIDGATGGIFVYSGPPALGNLIGSWAGASGTDSKGNTYPQGFNITMGAISGTAITGSSFSGTNFVLNVSGLFMYSGTPALGNLIISVAFTSGVDAFGNAYRIGVATYGSSNSYVQLAANGVPAVLFSPQGVTSLTNPGQILSGAINAGAVNEISELAISTGKESGKPDAAIQMASAAADSSSVAVAYFEFGGNAEVFIAPGFGIRAVQPGTAVTIESWHALAPANGWANVAGNVPLNYKMMPNRSVWVLGTLSSAAATTSTIGTLPALYRPVTQQAFIVATTGGGVATSDRYLQVSTAGVMTINDFSALPIAGVVLIDGFISMDV